MKEKYIYLFSGIIIIIIDIYKYKKYLDYKKENYNSNRTGFNNTNLNSKKAIKIRFLMGIYGTLLFAIYFLIKGLTMLFQ
jgi:hypothetical protein